MSSVLKFMYRNHRGAVQERRVLPLEVSFTVSEYYPHELDENSKPIPKWFLSAFCLERQEIRLFLIEKINHIHDDGDLVEAQYLKLIDESWHPCMQGDPGAVIFYRGEE